MIGAFLIGDRETVARLEALPERLRNRLTARITALALKLEDHVKSDYLSGQVLNVKTGALRRSIHNSIQSGTSNVTGIVGSYSLPYARFWELGFQGTETVRAHLRQQTMAFGRPMTPKEVMVRQHTRDVNNPGRPFLKPALADMRDEIVAGIEGAIQEAKQE